MTDDYKPRESREVIGSNDDLLIEILRRVPAVSIFRFKSVSKHWQSHLSRCEFTLLYDELSVSHGRGTFYGDFYASFDVENQKNINRPPFHTLDFYPDACGIRIVQSCNGLLLCCSKKESGRTCKYYVFNPTTKQFAVIRSIKGGPEVRNSILFMGLAFHPTECKHYKLVCFYAEKSYPNYDQSILGIQIYSSDTERWKLLNDVYATPNSPPFFKCGVYWNGGIYWAPSSFDSWYYFKLDEEKLQKLEVPSIASILNPHYTDIERCVYYFGESRGHLHLVVMIQWERRLCLNVYEMMSDHSGWFVKFQVPIDQILAEFSDFLRSNNYFFFQVLDVVRGEKEEIRSWC